MKTKTKEMLAWLIILLAFAFLAVCLGCHLGAGITLFAYVLLVLAAVVSAFILITIK